MPDIWIITKSYRTYLAKGFITNCYIRDIGYNGMMSSEDKDVKPWDLFNGSPRSPEELSEYRLEICSTCEFFRPNSKTCKKCGCFMTLKTSLAHAKCPLGKW